MERAGNDFPEIPSAIRIGMFFVLLGGSHLLGVAFACVVLDGRLDHLEQQAAKKADLQDQLTEISERLREAEKHLYAIHPRETGYRRPTAADLHELHHHGLGASGATPSPQRSPQERSVLKGGPRDP